MRGSKWDDLTGRVLDGRYELLSVVHAGEGHAEFTARAVPAAAPSELLSVTVFIPDEAGLEGQLNQIAVARGLNHPNLLRILEGGQCTFAETTLLFVVSEAAGRTLAQVSAEGPLKQKEAAGLARDLLAGLQYIHDQGFVCGSLEPDTVVRAGDRWKLADLSQLQPLASSPDPECDVKALGATLKAVLADDARRAPPFEAIVAGCLEPDPLRRLSAGDISRLLQEQELSPVVKHQPHRADTRPPSRFSSRIAVAGVLCAAFLLVAVLTALVLRTKPPAPPAQVTARAPEQTVTAPIPPPASASPVTTGTGAGGARPAAANSTVGRATFAADSSNGQPTASGEPFNNQAMTAAHASLPFGALVQVTNLRNGKTVVVRVNDRLPSGTARLIMVTRAAAERLGFVRAGSARVRIEPVPAG